LDTLAALKAKTLQKMWLDELDVLAREYTSYKAKRETIQAGSAIQGPTAGKAKIVKKRVFTA
jgi:hypothetical protein